MDLKEENSSVEVDKSLGWGSSLPVPSVQGMGRNDSKSIPERYIQKHEDRPLISQICPASSEIPTIDFSLLAKGEEDERKRLDYACKECGFFLVTEHEVAEEVLQKMKGAVKAFFDLPLVEKKKYAMEEHDVQGYGLAYVVSEEQKLDWNDLLFLITSPTNYKNIKYWQTTLPGFKEAVEWYSEEIERVSEEIFVNLSLLMGMKRNGLKKLHGGVKLGMRLNYYLTCFRPDLVLGVSPHSDPSSITLLLQDDDFNGLQIKHNGVWVPAKPVPNAIVVNIGDVMEA
ncbi:(S)-norcoclaurine synthase [Bertholletia excelsa]